MGNSMTYGPVPVPKYTSKSSYDNPKTLIPKKITIHNKMRQSDRYSRNGSYRGNGVRSS